MAENNEELLKNIWNQLTSDNQTTSDFETWKSNFSGSEEIQGNIYNYLKENNFTESDFKTWSTNVGLKKKENLEEEISSGVEEVTESVQTDGYSDSLEVDEVVEEGVINESELNFEDQSGVKIPKKTSINEVEVENKVFNEFIDNIETIETQANDPFSYSINTVTQELISGSEEQAVPLLKYHFNQYGFDFEETGMTGDTMNVTSANGEELSIDLDNFLSSNDLEESAALKSFLEKNKAESRRLYALENKYSSLERKITQDKDIDTSVNLLNTQANVFNKKVQGWVQDKRKLDQAAATFSGLTQAELNQPEVREAYINFQNAKAKNDSERRSIIERDNDLKTQGHILDQTMGRYSEMQAERGQFSGATINGIWAGVGRKLAGAGSLLTDAYINYDEFGGAGVGAFNRIVQDVALKMYGAKKDLEGEPPSRKGGEAYKFYAEEYKKQNPDSTKKERKAYAVEMIAKESEKSEYNYKNYLLNSGLTEDQKKEVKAKAKDVLAKQSKFDIYNLNEDGGYDLKKIPGGGRYSTEARARNISELSEGSTIETLRTAPIEVFGSSSTTTEYSDLMKEGFWGGAYLGLMESIPAMLGGPGAAGFAQRTASMFTQVSDHVNEEMFKDPDFANISENEKLSVAVPLGIIVGALESVGFRNVVKQKGLLNKVLLKSIGKYKGLRQVQKRGFQDVVRQEVDNMLARGLLTVAAGGVAEFETGAAQEIADIGIKALYNFNKEADMFQTPDSIEDGLKQVLKAGAQEAVGGWMMSVPGAMSNAAASKDFTRLDNGVFEVFEDMVGDGTSSPVFKLIEVDLKNKVNKGEITVKEAKEQQDTFNELQGVYNKIPSDYSTKQKKLALGLLLSKQELEQRIAGRDPSSVKSIQDKIDGINSSLEKIGRDALAATENPNKGRVEDEEDAISESITAIEISSPSNPYYFEYESEQDIPNKLLGIVPISKSEIEVDGKKKIKLTFSGQQLIDAGLATSSKTEKDALQKQSTESVDAQESSTGSETMGQGVSNEQSTNESNTKSEETTSETQAQEEIDKEEASDFEVLVNPDSKIESDIDNLPGKKQTVSNDKGVDIDLEVNEEGPNLSFTKKGKTEQENKFSNQILKQAKTAAKAISKIFPSIKIVIHRDNEQYRKIDADNDNGMYQPKDNTIHINLSKANGRTVAHEIFHAVLLNKLKMNDKAARAVTKKMVQALTRSKTLDKATRTELKKFIKNYDSEIQNEEKLSEIVGMIADNYTSLDVSSKSVVRKWVEKIAAGLGIEIGQSEADVVDLLNVIARKTISGQEITEKDLELLEPYTEGFEINVDPNAPMKPQPRQSKDIYKDVSFAEELPVVSMDNFIKKVEGKIFGITSDATKIGYDSKGDKIDGGFGYSAIKENILNKIGFASLDVKTATGTLGKIKKRYRPGDKVGIIIMVQNPSATVGNFYGGKYLGRGLLALKKESPESYQEVVDGFIDLLKNKSIATEMNKKTADKQGLIDLISSPEKYNETEFAEEWIKDTTFNARRTILESLLIGNNDIEVNKSTNPTKLKLKNAGFNTLDFLMEYGDVELLGENNIKNNLGGFAVGGFEMIVPENTKQSAVDASNRGLVHPQFNGKLPSNGNAFIFDGLYPMQENFVEFATKETRIPEENSSKADLLVRKIFKEDKYYKPEFLNGEKKIFKKDRGYKHLKSAFKIEFKKSNSELLIDVDPSVVANIARGMGFSPDANTPITEKTKFKPLEVRKQKVSEEIKLGKLINPARLSVAGIDISDLLYVASYGKDRIVNQKIRLIESDIKFSKSLSITSDIETTRLRDRLIKGIDVTLSVFAKEEKISKSKLIKRDGSINNRATDRIKDLASRIDILNDLKSTISENLFSPGDLELKTTQKESPEVRKQKVEIKMPEFRREDSPYSFELGGVAYVPTKEMMNFLDVRGDRKEMYESEYSRKRIDKIKESLVKNGWQDRRGGLYVDVDAYGNGWIGEGNHRLIAANELGMESVPVRVEFGAARDNPNKAIYDESYSANPTSIISKDKIDEFRNEADKKGYHIKNVSIWETNLVEDTNNKDLEIRKQKADDAKKLGLLYKMNIKGFMPNTIPLGPLQQSARKLGLRVERALFKEGYQKGQVAGYYFSNGITQNGKPRFYNPRAGVRKQQSMGEIGRSETEAIDIIRLGRENNIKDNTIVDYLKRNLSILMKDIKPLMKISNFALRNVPAVFGNIKGGMMSGIKVFNKVYEFRKNLLDNNLTATGKKIVKLNQEIDDKKSKIPQGDLFDAKKSEKIEAEIKKIENQISKIQTKARTENKKFYKFTQEEIDNATLDFLQSQPEYKAASNKGAYSTLQAQMTSQMMNAFEGGVMRGDAAARIKLARKLIKGRGKSDLQATQRDLRNFIRKSLPSFIFQKEDVVTLMRQITAATPKNIENLKEKVLEFVNKKTNTELTEKINEILGGKYQDTQSGRKKGYKVSNEVRLRLESIKKLLTDINSKTNVVVLETRGQELENKISAIEKLDSIEMSKMTADYSDLQIALNFVNAQLSLDISIEKTEGLQFVITNLTELVKDGKSELEADLRAKHLQYIDNFQRAYYEITGKKIEMYIPNPEFNNLQVESKSNPILISNPESKQALLDYTALSKAKKEGVINRAKVKFSELTEGMVSFVIGNNDLLNLMSKIGKMPGELFGGDLQEMVTFKIDESTNEFKARKMATTIIINEKVEEVYGRKWREKSQKDSIPASTGIVMSSGVKIEDLSQNQMAYLVNQYKDPSNQASYEKKYGKDYQRIMKEMEALLNDEVKELMRWQVEEFFPSLYDGYNEVYKKVYRTSMPWNEHYAGRIYREGVEDDSVDVLSNGKGSYKGFASPASTKSRIKNDKPIKSMDQMAAMMTYVNDMNYFAAYSENLNDVANIFGNQNIIDAIVNNYGKGPMKSIDTMIETLSKRGVSKEYGMDWINNVTSAFVIGRLAINPTIFIKQLTSAPAYAVRIGFRNWMKYGTMGIPDMKANWKEITDNSIYIQDRYGESILRTLETYAPSKIQSLVPSETKDNIINALMYLVKQGDKGAIVIGGVPNYAFYKDQYRKKNPVATDQEVIDYAVKMFERDTKSSQQSSDTQDKDQYQTGGAINRSLNMFLTSVKQYLRKEMTTTRNLYRKISSGGKEGKGTYWENVKTLAMYHSILPVIFQYISAGLPGVLAPWEDEDEETLLRAAALGNLNGLFIIGSFVEAYGDYLTAKPWTGQDISAVPILTIGLKFFKELNDANQYNVTPFDKNGKQRTEESINKSIAGKQNAIKKAFFNLSNAGLPLKQVERLIKNADLITSGKAKGNELILRILQFSDYQVTSKEQRDAARKKKTKPRQKNLTNKELERYNPEAYEIKMQIQDEFRNSEMYRQQQEIKRQQKERREQMLDEMYN